MVVKKGDIVIRWRGEQSSSVYGGVDVKIDYRLISLCHECLRGNNNPNHKDTKTQRFSSSLT